MPNEVYDDNGSGAGSDARDPGKAHYDKLVSGARAAEKSPAKAGGSAADNAEKGLLGGGMGAKAKGAAASDQIGGGYSEESAGGGIRSRLSSLKGRFTRLNKKAKAGIGGGILAGGIGLSSLVGLGSMQAIQLSQVLSLDQFSNEHTSDIRMNGLFRYARSGGDLGETRVSYLGSKQFGKAKADLSKIGVTFDANEKFGVLKGTVIELDKFPVTKDVPQKQAAGKLSDFFKSKDIQKSDIKIQGGKAYINQDLGIAARRAIAKDTISQLDGGKIATWVKTRQVTKFYNLPSAFHPFKKIDSKVNEKIATRAAAIQERKAQRQGNEYKSTKRAEAYKGLQEKTGGVRAGAAGALLITAGLCIARSAADDAIAYNREAIVIPQVADTIDAMAIGAQQQSGQDFTAQQLGVYDQLLTDENGKSVWDAQALQAKIDPSNTKGEPMPADYDQAFSEYGGAATLKGLGGIGGDIACSTGGQIGQAALGAFLAVASIPTGGGTAAAYAGLKLAGGAVAGVAAMGVLHNLLANALQDNPIPDDVSAPIKGNLLAYGSRELANVNARAAGGVDLGSSASSNIDKQMAAASKREFQSKPLFAKLFDAKDYRSVSGSMVAKVGSPTSAVRRTSASFLNIGSTLASTLRGFVPSAQAAAPYDYGFNRYGIPDRILNNRAYADPYANADNVAATLDSPAGQGYIDRALICFGVEIDKDSGGRWAVTPVKEVNPNTEEYETKGNCRQENDQNWDRIMLFVNDSSNMDSAACYLGDEDSCKLIGASSEASVCSIDNSTKTATATTAATNLPGWAKMPVVNATPGGAVSGNVKFAMANIKEGGNVAPSLKIMAGNNPDFIGLNEVGETSLNAMENAISGYGAYRDDKADNGPGGGERSLDNVIMWNKANWDFVTGGRIKTVEDDNTFYNGEPKVWDRWAAWAVFKRKSDGATVPVIVTHAMTNPARFPKQHDNPPMSRIKQYDLSMDVLLQLVGTLSPYGPVLVAGDMNSHPDQGAWAAVSKMKAAGYGYTFDNDIIYLFNPQGTRNTNSRTVPIPIGSDHGGNSLLSVVDMNNVGPGSGAAIPASTTSTIGCEGDAEQQDTPTAGSVTMTDDYAKECGQYTSCSRQCVDFVKFRLKKYIDKSKFDDFTTGTGGVAAYTSSENLGKQYGYTVNNTPAVNSVASWPAGGVPGSHANTTYGHVAMVSQVNSDGSIVVEEYNATTPALSYGTRKIPASVAKLLTYAHTEVDFK